MAKVLSRVFFIYSSLSHFIASPLTSHDNPKRWSNIISIIIVTQPGVGIITMIAKQSSTAIIPHPQNLYILFLIFFCSVISPLLLVKRKALLYANRRKNKAAHAVWMILDVWIGNWKNPTCVPTSQ